VVIPKAEAAKPKKIIVTAKKSKFKKNLADIYLVGFVFCG
jgi:hypothetical protein